MYLLRNDVRPEEAASSQDHRDPNERGPPRKAGEVVDGAQLLRGLVHDLGGEDAVVLGLEPDGGLLHGHVSPLTLKVCLLGDQEAVLAAVGVRGSCALQGAEIPVKGSCECVLGLQKGQPLTSAPEQHV